MRKSNRMVENYATQRSKMGVVRNVKRQAWYLSKYVSKGDFERYHFSSKWVFPGWIGFSGWFGGEFPVYPPREMLVELAKMRKVERAEHVWFGVYLWEKKRRGVWDVH